MYRYAKINMSEVMNRAHRLIKIYKIEKSEALRISWGIAKIAIMKTELDELNEKEIYGGKKNIFAQSMINEKEKAKREINYEINIIKFEIYPKKIIEKKIKFKNPTTLVTWDEINKKYIETKAEYYIEKEEYLNVTAYDAAV